MYVPASVNSTPLAIRRLPSIPESRSSPYPISSAGHQRSTSPASARPRLSSVQRSPSVTSTAPMKSRPVMRDPRRARRRSELIVGLLPRPHGLRESRDERAEAHGDERERPAPAPAEAEPVVRRDHEPAADPEERDGRADPARRARGEKRSEAGSDHEQGPPGAEEGVRQQAR